MNPDIDKFVSAMITLIAIAIVVRLILKRVAAKRPKIQKPDKRYWDKYI